MNERKLSSTEYTFYFKRAFLFLSSSKILTPPPPPPSPSPPGECVPPPLQICYVMKVKCQPSIFRLIANFLSTKFCYKAVKRGIHRWKSVAVKVFQGVPKLTQSHKVQYTHSIWIMSPRRNWDSPAPSPVSERAPRNQRGGGQTGLRLSGWGSPSSDDRNRCIIPNFNIPNGHFS